MFENSTRIYLAICALLLVTIFIQQCHYQKKIEVLTGKLQTLDCVKSCLESK